MNARAEAHGHGAKPMQRSPFAGPGRGQCTRACHNLFEYLPVCVMVQDASGCIQAMNPAAEEVFGLSVDEVVGRHPAELDTRILDAEGCKVDEANLPTSKALATGIPQENIEIQVWNPREQRYRCLLAWAVPHTRPNQDAPGSVLLAAIDITDRKEAGRQLEQSQEQLRELAKNLIETREEERVRIAREIHDELGSTLSALKIELIRLADAMPASHISHSERLEALGGLIDGTMTTLRQIITDLRPTLLDDLGLFAALEWQGAEFTRRHGIPCRVCTEGDQSLIAEHQAISLFRISQEALSNVAKHACASCVRLECHATPASIVLTIGDDGRGIPAEHLANPRSHGLRGMEERTHHLGGHFRLDTRYGKGTALRVELPLQ